MQVRLDKRVADHVKAQARLNDRSASKEANRAIFLYYAANQPAQTANPNPSKKYAHV